MFAEYVFEIYDTRCKNDKRPYDARVSLVNKTTGSILYSDSMDTDLNIEDDVEKTLLESTLVNLLWRNMK